MEIHIYTHTFAEKSVYNSGETVLLFGASTVGGRIRNGKLS